MSRILRATFPAACPGMLVRMFEAKGFPAGAPYVPSLCQCMTARIDALSPAQLQP